MDQNAKLIIRKQMERTARALERNNMVPHCVETLDEARACVASLLNPGDQVSVGGSMTLFEAGIIDLLRSGDYDFLDRYAPGADIPTLYRQSFSCDAYLTSSNAITENGELLNVDGNGNRVAAMIFGPKRVIVIAGYNKIVKDLDAAHERLKAIACPANCVRLDRKTPCTETGHCMDCRSTDRICSSYVTHRYQQNAGRIHVILVNEALGY